METAGGVRSPQADDGDAVDLVRLLAPDLVVLVADAGLGTINAVRLCVDALAGSGLAPGRRRPRWWWCSTGSTRPTTSTAATGPGWPTGTASRWW